MHVSAYGLCREAFQWDWKLNCVPVESFLCVKSIVRSTPLNLYGLSSLCTILWRLCHVTNTLPPLQCVLKIKSMQLT